MKKIMTDLLGKLVSRVPHDGGIPIDSGIVRAVYVNKYGPILLVEVLTDWDSKTGDLTTWPIFGDGRISTTRHRYGAEEAYLKRVDDPEKP